MTGYVRQSAIGISGALALIALAAGDVAMGFTAFNGAARSLSIEAAPVLSSFAFMALCLVAVLVAGRRRAEWLAPLSLFTTLWWVTATVTYHAPIAGSILLVALYVLAGYGLWTLTFGARRETTVRVSLVRSSSEPAIAVLGSTEGVGQRS